MNAGNSSNPVRHASRVEVVLFRVLLTGCLTVAGISTAFGQLIWSEEFESGTALDNATWSYDLGASGWGNNELQEYTNNPENVRIKDGSLVITVQETMAGGSGRGFTSARVRTQDKLTFKYADIEARIRIPDLANGLWPAFWTLGNNFSQVGWPACGELDIMEMGSSSAISDGVINQRVGSTAHWQHQGNYANYGLSLDTASRLDDGFHVFRMSWTPSQVATYIDDEPIWVFDITSGSCTDCSEFHQPHFVILNMAVGGNYTGLLGSGEITASTPAEMLIDYVRIYNNGFTELGGSSLPRIGPEYSGSWYNPGQSGHGFSMEFGVSEDGSPLAIIYWYTFDTLGNPIFLVGTGKPNGKTLDVQFQSALGMNYGEFDPNSVDREDAGTALLDFSDSGNAVFSYTPSAFSASTWGHAPINDLPLVKLFGVPVSNATSTSR